MLFTHVCITLYVHVILLAIAVHASGSDSIFCVANAVPKIWGYHSPFE